MDSLEIPKELIGVSLPEVYRTLTVPSSDVTTRWRMLLAFAGPGFLVSVGYMDPGNWATDLAAGSQFGYALLFVVTLSSLMAMLLQALALKLGVVTGRDLAQLCRDSYSKPMRWFLWLMAEIAIAACDLAEVIGSAIALQLLFGIPLPWGVCITAADVLIILWLQQRGFRYLEALVITLIGIVGFCFLFEIILSNPEFAPLVRSFVMPSPLILTDRNMLYIAMGILGATVMPHNLYLHSSIVQTRDFKPTTEGRREALHYALWDSNIALTLALFVNAAILVMAAAVFFRSGHHEVAEIQDAHKLLSPLLGVTAASTLFAVALLASGQSSTLTGTLAGQIVMEGFLQIRLKPWQRRLLTRGLAIIPAIITAFYYGSSGTAKLLVFSQVVLSVQLSFAVVPLVIFTSDVVRMGEFVNPIWLKWLSWTTAVLIAILNVWLLVQMLK